MKRIIGFIICFFAIILPCRIRIIYSEILGWMAQLLYLLYFSIAKFIIKNFAGVKKGGE